MRIGETLQIKKDDLDLDSEPARINLRHEYTKNGESGRTVFLTDEAKEYLENYLEWRKGKKKGNGVPYDETDKVFPFSEENARGFLNRALEKTRLDDRDEETGRRKIHIHSTRKFFRFNCGLGDALTHAIMGHRRDLDRSYLRQNKEKAGRKFKEIAEPNLTILTSKEGNVKQMVRLESILDRVNEAKRIGRSEEEILSMIRKTLSERNEETAIRDEKTVNSPNDIDWTEVSEETYQEIKSMMSREMGRMKIPEKLTDEQAEKVLKQFEESGHVISELELTDEIETKTKNKIVKEEELEEFFDKGWTYVDKVNENKVVIEKEVEVFPSKTHTGKEKLKAAKTFVEGTESGDTEQD
ncbi:hypothetical protein AKJ39_00980 [candidate division MSBL1 archaeon SCGC-AAA259J03]|uniref:Tyr recombinase domain-containing protein n=1 Tax=candidate division MSBL1 archaeon SCGC-AAA259J03 TaxID=1698269 RepID=A0A656YX36_9EURY|nr:hypothetical protein AKJ39_00980 [candidate division MSBL1 archaeon SCGC-AAA259J03]